MERDGGQIGYPRETEFMQANPAELSEEIAARKETENWELAGLRDCPCCKAKARVEVRDYCVRIMCSQWLCRVVEGKTFNDALYVWNQSRFTDK